MFKTLVLLTLLLSGAGPAQAALSFSAADRIVVVAPHPDDESLGLGGLLQRAKASGASVRVVYLTNGESNEVASIFHQKRPLLWRSDFVKSGVLRKKEALEANARLGLADEELIFFGYPDSGLLNMWTRHWADAKPYRSFFTRLSRVPYKDNYSSGHAFKSDEIVKDLEFVLSSFSPTAVFVTAPFDLNTDHQAAFLYTQVALMNLRALITPTLYVYLIHARDWPQPKHLAPEEPLEPPKNIDWSKDVHWESFSLTYEELKKKTEALSLYKSQLSYKRNFLLAFARKSELYAAYPPEKLNGAPPAAEKDGASKEVRYKVMDDELWIEIPLSSMVDEMGVLSAYVFGYRDDSLFADMPKLAFRLFGNKIFAYDAGRSFHDPELVYRFERDRLFVRIPLRLLKDPEVLFVSTRNAKEPASLDFSAWRVLEVL